MDTMDALLENFESVGSGFDSLRGHYYLNLMVLLYKAFRSTCLALPGKERRARGAFSLIYFPDY